MSAFLAVRGCQYSNSSMLHSSLSGHSGNHLVVRLPQKLLSSLRRRAIAWKQYMSWIRPYWYNNALQAAYEIRKRPCSTRWVKECVCTRRITLRSAEIMDGILGKLRRLWKIWIWRSPPNFDQSTRRVLASPIVRSLFTYSPHQRHGLCLTCLTERLIPSFWNYHT